MSMTTSEREALRVKVAELCGWRKPGNGFNAPWIRGGTDEDADITYRLPDYPNDLNAIHEAEEILDADQSAEYTMLLKRTHPTYCVLDHERGDDAEINYQTFSLIHATAEQRCLAFVATMEGKSQR